MVWQTRGEILGKVAQRGSVFAKGDFSDKILNFRLQREGLAVMLGGFGPAFRQVQQSLVFGGVSVRSFLQIDEPDNQFFLVHPLASFKEKVRCFSPNDRHIFEKLYFFFDTARHNAGDREKNF